MHNHSVDYISTFPCHFVSKVRNGLLNVKLGAEECRFNVEQPCHQVVICKLRFCSTLRLQDKLSALKTLNLNRDIGVCLHFATELQKVI